MSAVTDTTNHENGGRGDSRIAPTGGWPGVFSEESFMQPCGCTPWDENVCGAEAGNHKGCPYNGFVGVYFRTNRSCRLSPTPPIMKMGVRAIRESPLREVGRGYFLRNHPCRLVTCTPRDENGERRLAEEFDRQWRFEPAEESVTCGPSSTPSCCHSVMSEHAYQLEYMWGRPLPAIPDGGEGNASVVRAMRRVGCPQKVDHRVRAHR